MLDAATIEQRYWALDPRERQELLAHFTESFGYVLGKVLPELQPLIARCVAGLPENVPGGEQGVQMCMAPQPPLALPGMEVEGFADGGLVGEPMPGEIDPPGPDDRLAALQTGEGVVPRAAMDAGPQAAAAAAARMALDRAIQRRVPQAVLPPPAASPHLAREIQSMKNRRSGIGGLYSPREPAQRTSYNMI